tara:strand:+ start:286 stop:993 length:708 start_codon:yes stop_codon:yes gene_type:complete
MDDAPAPDASLLRALAIFVAGMALLLAIDLLSEPTGQIGQDRAIEGALSASNEALSSVTEPGAAKDDPAAAERRERAQSSAFFLEQANLAWRRGEDSAPEEAAVELGGAAVLAVLGKLWMLGWLLLPLGALAARLACPGAAWRHPHWYALFAARSLGGSGGLVALALTAYGLGAPAPFVLAPLVSAIVVLNAWLLREHAKLDRSATLLRLGPLLIIIAVLLVLAREILLHLTIVP